MHKKRRVVSEYNVRTIVRNAVAEKNHAANIARHEFDDKTKLFAVNCAYSFKPIVYSSFRGK